MSRKLVPLVVSAVLIFGAAVATVNADTIDVVLTYKNSQYQVSYDMATKRLFCSSENAGAVWQSVVGDNVPSPTELAAAATPGGPIFLYTQIIAGQPVVNFCMLHFRTGAPQVPISGESLRGVIGRGRLQSATFDVRDYGAYVTIVAVDGDTQYTYTWDINMFGTSKQVADPVVAPAPGGTTLTGGTGSSGGTTGGGQTVGGTTAGGAIAGGTGSGIDLSILFLVDCSGSMSGSKIDAAKMAVVNSVNQTNDGKTEWALLGFGGECTCWQVVPFTTDAGELQQAVQSLDAHGGTPLTYSIYKATAYLVRNGRGRSGRLIVLCDGENSCNIRQGGGTAEAAAGLRSIVTSANLRGRPSQP